MFQVFGKCLSGPALALEFLGKAFFSQRAEIVETSRSLEEMRKSYTDSQSMVTSLEKVNADLKESKGTLYAANKALDKENEDLGGIIADLEESANGFREELRRRNSEISELKLKGAGLEGENTTLRQTNTDLESENTTLRQTNTDLESENTTLKGDKAQLLKNKRAAENSEKKAKRALFLASEKIGNCEKALQIGTLIDENVRGKAKILVQELQNSGEIFGIAKDVAIEFNGTVSGDQNTKDLKKDSKKARKAIALQMKVATCLVEATKKQAIKLEKEGAKKLKLEEEGGQKEEAMAEPGVDVELDERVGEPGQNGFQLGEI